MRDKEFGVRKMMREFVDTAGQSSPAVIALVRSKGGTPLCPISTMQDLLDLAVESDKVLTSG